MPVNSGSARASKLSSLAAQIVADRDGGPLAAPLTTDREGPMRGAGDTTFTWNLGGGNQSFSDSNGGGVDQLVFGPGIAPGDITIAYTANDVVITHVPSGAVITLDDSNYQLGYSIEKLVFDGGTVIDLTQGTTFVGTVNADTAYGSLYRDTLSGGDAGDTLHGLDGDDALNGQAGDDVLNGGDGADILKGGDGLDQLNGGVGDDTLQGGVGDDTLNGGDGAGDWAWHQGETTGVTVDLAAQTATGTAIGTDTLVSIENAFGSNGVDALTGSAETNVLNGSGGADVVNAGGGNDEALGGAGADAVNGGDGDDFVYGDEPYSPSQTSTQTGLLPDGSPFGISLTGARADPDGTTSVIGYVGAEAPGATNLNVVFVIDRSGSMSSTFQGTETVGDLDGNGVANTLMDGAIAAYSALVNSLIDTGLGDTRISIVEFDDNSSILYSGAANRDSDNDGVPDAIEALRTLRADGSTYYDLGLQQAIQALQNSPRGSNYVFFESDGAPNGGPYADEVQTLLNSFNANIRALGLGSGASLTALDLVDDGVANNSAERVLTPSTLTAGLLNSDVDPADIDRVEILVNGVLVRTIDADDLDVTPFGLRFSADLTGLSTTAADVITARVVSVGPNPVTVTTTLTIAQTTQPVGGDDVVHGNAGHDHVQGDAGADQLFGDAGDDNLVGGPGADLMDGGDGWDTADYSQEFQNVSVNLATGTATGAVIGTDSLVSLEAARGGFGGDVLTAHDGAPGVGGVGLVVKDATTINNSIQTAFVIGSVFGLDSNPNIENATTTPHATIQGTAVGGSPEYYAITVTAGETVIFDIDGTPFDSTLRLYNSAGTEVAYNDDSSSDPGSSSANSRLSYTFASAGVYYIAVGYYYGSGGALSANAAYTLHISQPSGTLGQAPTVGATLDGGAGADTLVSGRSGDTLNGGAGLDVASFVNATTGVTVDLRLLTAQDTGDGLDRLISIEGLTGSAFADDLTGDSGANSLNGGGGVDRLVGGLGSDSYYVDHASDVIVEARSEGTDTVFASATYTLASGVYVENLTLTGSSGINGTGNGLDNTLTGNSGVNRLAGGKGDDKYYVQNATDVIVEAKDQGADTVYSTVSFELKSGVYVEGLTLLGTANINGTGNGIANTLKGNTGNNVLNGGAGADKLYGGKGNDTYYVDNSGDKAYEKDGEGTDTVVSSATYSLSGQYIEKLTLTGSANLNGTGNGLNNTLTGNSGINVLTGGKGNDAYYVQNATDSIVELKDEGTDTVFSSVSFVLKAGSYVEGLTLTGSANINATGNGIDNVLTGNAGKNTLTGGKGNDAYYVQTSTDTVVEKKGEGTDHVFSTVSFSLEGQYIEYLTLTGSSNIYAKGNSVDNRLVGNTGNNKINGMGGQDRLTGGGGSDTFIWDATSHSKVSDSDRITDLSSNDFIDLSRIDANVNVGGTQHFVLVDAFTNTAGQVKLDFDGTWTNLTADTNGDGVADMLVRIDGDHEDFDNFIFGG